MNLFKTILFVLVSLMTYPCFAQKTICPQNVVQDTLKAYTLQEKALIHKDLKNIRELTFSNSTNLKKGEKLTYLATAGGPASAKSTILEAFMKETTPNNQFCYIDPDRVSLRSMIYTYIPYLSSYNISKSKSYNDLLEEAYNKWRGGSNYIALTLLNEAAEKQRNIAHGTTSTYPNIGNLYKNLKEKGYEIVLLLCGANDETRLMLNQHRQQNQGFFQVDPVDFIEKGKAFPERFKTYFTYADKIYIYWTEDLTGSVLAAIYSPQTGLDVKDQQALEKFVKTHGNLPVGQASEQVSMMTTKSGRNS